MNHPYSLFLVFLPFLFFAVDAQPSPDNQSNSVSFRPSVAIIIGIFSVMFSLTFLLLMYAKFCHPGNPNDFSHPGTSSGGALLVGQNRFSGIDQTVIESLPFFRFSSLKGARDGLECAVCLSKFEDTEILRLLPKCKHAFHIDCVDRWLEAHSSCPLCRYRVEIDDVAFFKYSNSSRFLFRNPSERREEEGGELELFVQREPGEHPIGGSSRFSIGSSCRKLDVISLQESKLDGLLVPERDGGNDDDNKFLHKFKHRIIVSDVVFKSRWSDVNASDLMSLNSEMISMISSKRFNGLDLKGDGDQESAAAAAARSGGMDESSDLLKIKEEMERKRLLDSKASEINRNSHLVDIPAAAAVESSEYQSGASRSLISPGNNRCMSEITNVGRFGVMKNPSSTSGRSGGEVERVRKLWLPIARRTMQWFAGRERRSAELSNV